MILSGVLYNAGGPVTNAKIIFIATQTSLNGVLKGAYRAFTTQADGTYFLDLEPGYYRVEWYPSKGPLVRLGTVLADADTMATLPQALRGAGVPVDPDLVVDEVQEALNQVRSARDEAEQFAQDAADSAASLDAANIVHAPRSGLANEAGSAYAYDVGHGDNEVPVNADFGALARLDSLSEADIGDLEAFKGALGVEGAGDIASTGYVDEGLSSRVAVGAVGEEAVTTSTGTQTVAEALDSRVAKGELGSEDVVIGTDPVSVESRFSEYVTPFDYGGVPGEDNDATSAIESAIHSGKPIYFGHDLTWTVSREITHTLSRSLIIRSDNSVIKVQQKNSGDEIRSVFRIFQAGHPVIFSGELTTDGNNSSFSGWVFYNPSASERSGVVIQGYRGQNFRRASTDHLGGDGLFISGAYEKVTLQDVHIKNVTMAAGAGIVSSQGIAGITVTRNSTEQVDAKQVYMSNIRVENLFSEDPAFQLEQDGVRVFQSYNNPDTTRADAFCTINGLTLSNVAGRGIKLQTDFASVSDVYVYRDATVLPRKGVMPEFDFQVSGGTLRGVKLNYTGAQPDRIVNATLRRNAGKYNPLQIIVDDVSVVRTGTGGSSPGSSNMIAMNAPELTENEKINISFLNWWETSSSNYTNFLRLIPNTGNGLYNIRLDTITARPTSELILRDSNAGLMIVNAIGIYTPAQTPVFIKTTNNVTSDIRASLLGSNSGITDDIS